MLKSVKTPLSIIALIAANALPIFGVVFAGWDLYTVFFLYWAETAVIGVYTALKLIRIPGGGFFKVFLIPFLFVHLGAFMGAHFIFITLLLAPGIPLDLSRPAALLPVIIEKCQGLALPILGLFVSHGISFFSNFLGKKEYARVNITSVVMAPYRRVTLMHLTILFGGVLVAFLGAPVYALVSLVILKTAVDVLAHRREHAKLQQSKA